MHTSNFPMNYFKSIWTPKSAFNNRKQLNWFQMALVFILLTLAMILPVYTHYQSIDSFSILDFYPNAVGLVDEEAIDGLQQTEFSNGELQLEEMGYLKESEHGILAIGVRPEDLPDLEEESNGLLFRRGSFVISDENGSVERVNYTEDFSLSHITSRDELVHEMSRLYTEQNRSSIVLSFTLVIYLFIFVALLFIVFIYAYLLFLTKDFTLSSIMTYKEAVNLILNLMGIPTILALIYGFYRFNVITMVGIQIIGLISLLVILYKQTKFQEEHLE